MLRNIPNYNFILMKHFVASKRFVFFHLDTTVFFNSDVHLNPNGPLYLLPTKDHPHGIYTDTNFLQPRTKEEIVWILKSVAATQTKAGEGSGSGRRIRVVGSGHSWSKVAKSNDIQLSLENYKVHITKQEIDYRSLIPLTYKREGVQLLELSLKQFVHTCKTRCS